MKSAFTLIELIMAVVISAILAIGSFKAIEALYLKSAKARAVTELSLQSQIVLDQIAALLYRRVPGSVIGYLDESGNHDCEPIDDATRAYRILEWLDMDEPDLLIGRYDGFVDLNASSASNLRALRLKGGTIGSGYGLVFAGSLDRGDAAVRACEGAFGWHGGGRALLFDADLSTDDTIGLSPSARYVYEKYYLTGGALAVARGEDVDLSGCASPPFSAGDLKSVADTLFLFYGYRPWAGETFCGDTGGSGTKAGGVTVLTEDVAGFAVDRVNGVIRLRLDMNRSIRGGGSVHITKQKAVF